MMYLGNMSDSDKDSAFDSAEEDVVFRLYEQLYFEPNPEVVGDDAKQDHLPPLKSDKPVLPQPSSLQHSTLCESETIMPKSLTSLKSSLSKNITAAQSSGNEDNRQFENFFIIDTPEGSEVKLSELESYNQSNHGAQKQFTVQQQTQLQTKPLQTHKISLKGGVLQKKIVVSTKSQRERLSSTCSDGSIPGSIPLDGLYCTAEISDEEGEERIKEKLKMKDTPGKDPKQTNKHARSKPSKRKRTGSTSSDEVEDSRCSSLLNAVSKKASGKLQYTTFNGDENEEEDGDLYILPPPAAAAEADILTVISSSDSEVKVMNESLDRLENKTYRRVEESPRSTLKIKFQRQTPTKSDILVSASDSDSSEVDLPEATKGTNLTLNIDRSLSSLLQPLPKESLVVNIKNDAESRTVRKVTKKLKNQRSSVDFTKGRADTKTTPSCAKWTQAMANFYDSDVSDEFDVLEIHQQQSSCREDWRIDPADLQIRSLGHSRRYYTPERCKRCRQDDHTTDKCSRVPVCHLCGSKDHTTRAKCPENCCFKCGGDPHFLCRETEQIRACQLCGYQGHSKKLCPDLWRRYHLTTEEQDPVAPSLESIVCTTLKEKYCYSCGRQGHYGYECSLRRLNAHYMQVQQQVVSYSQPVIYLNGSFIVNTEGAKSPVKVTNLTELAIKPYQVGKIIGKKGVTVKAIVKDTGAMVQVVQDEQPKVLLQGPLEARLKAQDLIISLLKMKSSICEDSLEQLKRIASNPPIPRVTSKDVTPGTTTTTTHSAFATYNNASHQLTGPSVSNSIPDVSPSVSETFPAVLNNTTTHKVLWYERLTFPWRRNFLKALDRQKSCVLRTLKDSKANLLSEEDYNYVNLKKSIKLVHKFVEEDKFKKSNKISKHLSKHLKKISVHTVGKAKFGKGYEICDTLTNLTREVERFKGSTIPEHICVQIANTLEYLYDPPAAEINKLLRYATTYNKMFFEKNKTSVGNQNLPSKNKKTNYSSNTSARNEIGEAGTVIGSRVSKRSARRKLKIQKHKEWKAQNANQSNKEWKAQNANQSNNVNMPQEINGGYAALTKDLRKLLRAKRKAKALMKNTRPNINSEN